MMLPTEETIRAAAIQFADGEPPTEDAIRRAIAAAPLFSENPIPSRIIADIEGGIAFTFRASDLYADVEFWNEGSTTATLSHRGTPGCDVWYVVGEGGLEDARERIIDFMAKGSEAGDGGERSENG